MKLTDISYIKDIMTRHETAFKKKYGQNFLINSAIPERIAENLTCREHVIEIGAGIGSLTYELSKTCGRVTAVEIDTDLLPILDETLAECGNVKIVGGDILKMDIVSLTNGGGDYSIAANLPYYITTPVVMYLLACKIKPKEIIIMVQKEVADRLCANAGDKDYGAITASVAWFGKAEKLFNVSPGSFMPPPKIESTVMKITSYEVPPYEISNEQILNRVIKGAFAQRRKTLINALSAEFSHINKQTIGDIVISCGFDETIRGERLDIADFAMIANMIDRAG